VSLIDVFTLLIFFLMSNAGVETLTSARAVQLPESMSQKAPKETLLVVVTASEILVGGTVVSSVADALAVQDDIIQPLKASLDVEASRGVILKENEADSKRITIMGDKDIPYRLLKKVMVSAARAGYSDVSFAVRQRFEP
jgi:biopolymer transport protein ExbD